MGVLTRTELRDEIKAHLASRSDITDSEYNRALNLTQVRMARRHDFQELSIRATGTLTFTGVKATDQLVAYSVFTSRTIDDIVSFILHDGSAREEKLTHWTPRQLDKYVPNAALESTGFPMHYTKWAEQLELFRVPDQAYEFIFRAYAKPDDIATDGATSELDQKDDLLIFLTTAYMYGRLGEYERANYYFSIYKDELNASILDDIDEADEDIKPRQVLAGTFQDYWKNPFVRG